jgi:hypothetical protein
VIISARARNLLIILLIIALFVHFGGFPGIYIGSFWGIVFLVVILIALGII